jgi:hypothetical protein
MGATSDNYEIVTGGITYTIASDYVNPFGGETAHFQIVKTVYGTDDSVTNITTDTPLPVQPFGAWSRYEYLATSGYYGLATTIVGFTGNAVAVEGIIGGQGVGVTGTVSVVATDLDTRPLRGGTVGSGTVSATDDYLNIEGICGGYPIGITTSDSIPVTFPSSSTLAVYGVSGATALGVTFGTVDVRGLTAASDTVTVYGGGTASTVSVGLFGFTGATASPIYADGNALNVNIKTSAGLTVSAADLDIRDLDDATDSVTVVGEGAADQAGFATVPTYINGKDANGNLIQIGGITGAGWSAGALNVYLVNNGITFSVNANATFSAQVGVTATPDSALPIQGSTYAASGVWVVGSTGGGPVVVQGNSGGFLPVEVSQFPELYNLLNANVTNLDKNLSNTKSNTDFLVAVKKALFASNISVSSNDYPDEFSIYNQVKTNVGDRLAAIENTIVPNGQAHSTQNSLSVNVTKVKRVSSFMSRTGFVGNTPLNLTSYNSSQGFTCEMGVRIKVSRVPSGTNSSQNEIMCVISEADAAIYGASSVAASYVMYHGDEMFFEVDNIDKIKVFYPALSASNAPSNTSSGLTFSFYAS